MPPLVQRRYTPEEYLALERAAPHRSEYVNGQIYAMAGASRRHILIVGNIQAELRTLLRDRPCETYTTAMRVKVTATGVYTYPDVVVACGQPRFEDASIDTLLDPTLVVEVLSESTESYDRGEKFAHYRRLESLREYVLVAQDKARVEVFVRQGEHWVLTEFSDPAGEVPLESIDCALRMQDIYERVELGASADSPARM